MNNLAIQPKSLDELSRLGGIFRQSGYFKNVTDEAQAVTKILYGMELGFSPVTSMMGIYIVDGKPALSGNLLGALVKMHPHYNFFVKDMSDKQCIIEFLEDGAVIGISTFTMEDAKLAGLVGKDSWRKYPKAMLYNRALSAGVRAFCPDITTAPVYSPEELGAEVTDDNEVVSIPETKSTTIQEPITLVSKPKPVPVEPVVTEVTTTAVEIGDEPQYIDVHQRSYLSRRFRESIKKELESEASEYRHKALAALSMSGLFKSKLVDDNGNPTQDFILQQEYQAIGKALVAAAKSL